ncbi:eugenol synthase 1 [Morus notabilis]|uniref:eugenol synthase 1 n=1 Tax=Morus notabilis TaxID=981085 RepID=UPI000CECFF5E|nr:eugenol synthase 1 [Morus notabilis]
MAEESGASKVLVFGGTGYIGSYVVKASVSLGHPTYVYSRDLTPETPPPKKEILQHFESIGVSIVYGTLEEQEKLVGVLRQVDVVICTFAFPQVLDQLKIIDAIKIAGNIKRFIPADFGLEEERVKPLKPFQELLNKKSEVRRAAKEAGIPYTFVSANFLGAYFMNKRLCPHENPDQLVIFGSGDVKVAYVYEEDLGAYTVKAANDPRTLNRIVNCRPRANIITTHELFALWEKKTGRTFKKVYVTAEELVKLAETLPSPQNVGPCIRHAAYVKGESVIDFEGGEEEILEASQLYPDHKYTTIDELLDIMLVNPPKPASTAMG